MDAMMLMNLIKLVLPHVHTCIYCNEEYRELGISEKIAYKLMTGYASLGVLTKQIRMHLHPNDAGGHCHQPFRVLKDELEQALGVEIIWETGSSSRFQKSGELLCVAKKATSAEKVEELLAAAKKEGLQLSITLKN